MKEIGVGIVGAGFMGSYTKRSTPARVGSLLDSRPSPAMLAAPLSLPKYHGSKRVRFGGHWSKVRHLFSPITKSLTGFSLVTPVSWPRSH